MCTLKYSQHTPSTKKSVFYADCILASFFLFIHSNQWKFHLFFILNSNHHDCHLSLGNGTTQWCWHLNLSFWHLVTAAFFVHFFNTFNNRMKKKQVTNLKLLGYLMDNYSQVRYVYLRFFRLLEFVGSLKMLLLSHEFSKSMSWLDSL